MCFAADDRKKRPRTAFSASQIKALEGEFEKGKYLSVAKRTSLAKSLNLTETQVRKIIFPVGRMLCLNLTSLGLKFFNFGHFVILT